jgi:S-disulfanyl-L-cysteine oxidoreductase SoxD
VNVRLWLAAAIGFTAICAGYSALRAQGTSRSVWDGVYTGEQAERGEPKYKEHCALCHGENLEGDEEDPPLSGAPFMTNWDGLPLGDLYVRIHRDMPLNWKVGKLNPDVCADILAYMLSVNGFPRGGVELPHAPEVLNQIRFQLAKPGARSK